MSKLYFYYNNIEGSYKSKQHYFVNKNFNKIMKNGDEK